MVAYGKTGRNSDYLMVTKANAEGLIHLSSSLNLSSGTLFQVLQSGPYLLDHPFSFQWHCGCVCWSLSMHKALLDIRHYQHKTFSSYCAPLSSVTFSFLITPSSTPQVSCAEPC